MATLPRLDEPGSYHHVWSRGVAQMDIVRDDADRRVFVSLARAVIARSGAECLAWALLTNHYHLLLQTGEAPLSRVMQQINGLYARKFNGRHGRSGHVFQGRFGSRIARDDDDLLGLIAYVHLNPLRAGVVRSPSELEDFPWAGHGTLTRGASDGLVDSRRVLGLLGSDPQMAQAAVRDLLLAAWGRLGEVRPTRPEALVAVEARARVQARIYGVEQVRSRWDYIDRVVRERESRTLRQGRNRARGWTPEQVLDTVCSRLGVRPADVRAGRRSFAVVRARAIACHLAHECLGARLTDLARLAGVGVSAVGRCVDRGRAEFDELTGTHGAQRHEEYLGTVRGTPASTLPRDTPVPATTRARP